MPLRTGAGGAQRNTCRREVSASARQRCLDGFRGVRLTCPRQTFQCSRHYVCRRPRVKPLQHPIWSTAILSWRQPGGKRREKLNCDSNIMFSGVKYHTCINALASTRIAAHASMPIKLSTLAQPWRERASDISVWRI